jgi:hypothetical protein
MVAGSATAGQATLAPEPADGFDDEPAPEPEEPEDPAEPAEPDPVGPAEAAEAESPAAFFSPLPEPESPFAGFPAGDPASAPAAVLPLAPFRLSVR